MEKLVSTIITSFNSNKNYLKEAIQSVLDQTYQNIEIIVVDDGSTNGVCKEVCNSFGDKVKYIYQENKGLPAARNTGIKVAKGEFICFLDDDDIWHKDKVEKQINRFIEVEKIDSNMAMTFTYCNVMDESNNHLGSYGYKVAGNIFDKILYGNIIGAPSSVMIKKESLMMVGLFNEEFRYAEDLELWYRVTRKYSVYSTDDYLIDYRWRNNSLSKNIDKMDFFTEKALLNIIEEEKNNIEIFNKRKDILSHYYINMANEYFLTNNIHGFKKAFSKMINNRFTDMFKNKLIIKYIMCIFGKKLVSSFNNLKQDNVTKVPNSIKDYTRT